MTIESNNNPINHIVDQTVLAMLGNTEKRAEWFEFVRKFQNNPHTQDDDDFQELLYAIVLLLLGDRPENIKINPINSYSYYWTEILVKLKLVEGIFLATDNATQATASHKAARDSAFSKLAYQESIVSNYDEIFDSLSADEIDILQTLVLWDGPFGPIQCEKFGINKILLDNFVRCKVITAAVDTENDLWFNIPAKLQDLIIAKLSAEQIKDNHKKIVRYLRKELTQSSERHSIRSAPLELVKNIDGSPVSEDGIDLIEGLFLTQFFEKMLFQTENIDVAQSIAYTIGRLITHQLGCCEYRSAFFDAQLLSKAYMQWGKVEEGEQLLSSVINAWQQADPERATKAISQYRQENTADQSIDQEKTETFEEINKTINELRSKNDFLGLARKHLEISENLYNYPTEGLQKALDHNFLAELYAKKCKDTLALANIFHLRGRIYATGKFFDEAIGALNKALSAFRQANALPGVMYTQLSFALVYYQNDMFVETVVCSQEAIGLAMKYNDLLSFAKAAFFMAKALIATGETEFALQLFQKILEETANDPSNSYSSIRQEVLAEIQKISEMSPGNRG